VFRVQSFDLFAKTKAHFLNTKSNPYFRGLSLHKYGIKGSKKPRTTKTSILQPKPVALPPFCQTWTRESTSRYERETVTRHSSHFCCFIFIPQCYSFISFRAKGMKYGEKIIFHCSVL